MNARLLRRQALLDRLRQPFNRCVLAHLLDLFVPLHQTLRVTPTMEAGLAHTVWTIEDMVKLMERKPVLDGLYQAA